MNTCAIFVGLAIGSAFTFNAYAQGIEVKGITLGEPESALERNWVNPGPACADMPASQNALGDRQCGPFYSSYGGAEVQFTFYMLGGTIEAVRLHLKPTEFDEVIAAMRSRFGAPTSDRAERVVTRAGVPHTNRVISWRRQDGTVEGQRYAGSISESEISFNSMRYIAEFAKRDASKQRARARDL